MSTTVFAANDDALGRELWMTDGTAAGTTLLLDTNPGAASGGGGEQIFFTADDGVHGAELLALSLEDLGTWVIERFGIACGTDLNLTGQAVVGSSLRADVQGAALSPGLLLGSLGPKWLDFGLGCKVYAWPPIAPIPFATGGAGYAFTTLDLPPTPNLAGVGLAFQAVILGTGPEPQIQLSNGVEVWVGP